MKPGLRHASALVCTHQRNVMHAKHVSLLLRQQVLQEDFYRSAIYIFVRVTDIFANIYLTLKLYGSLILLFR